jgi:fumarate hydratase class II
MRIEKDSMGEVQVPDDAYYGASTQRSDSSRKNKRRPFRRQPKR